MKQQTDFYAAIAQYYDDIFPLKRAVVEFVCRYKNDHHRLLDVGCASGALITALAEEGFTCTGIDIDASLLQQAKRRIVGSGVEATAHWGNMLDLDTLFNEKSFDVVTCFGNTLSHIKLTDKDALFASIYRIIDDTGVFCGQIINYPNLLRQQRIDLPTIATNRIRFERTYHIKNLIHPFTFEATLHDASEQRTLMVSQSLHPWTQEHIHTALQTAGFTNIQFYSGFDASPVSNTALPLVFVAQKTGLCHRVSVLGTPDTHRLSDIS